MGGTLLPGVRILPNFNETMTRRLSDTQTRWLVLLLAALTDAVAVAVPSMGMSVLFKEISAELGLNLVQVGLVWGIGSLPGMLTFFLAGAAGDRFGPRRMLVLAVLLTGLAGALRGFSNSFLSLVISVGLLGALTPFVLVNCLKTLGLWFPRQQLGLANGVLSGGMALGFLIGSMLSATVMSPWLGGWRNVFFLYGALAALFSIPWYFSPPAPQANPQTSSETGSKSMRKAMVHVIRLRNVWLMGLALLGVGGCVQGMLGYLPLYLRGLGWPGVQADGALAAFHLTSLVSVVPITLWSDRLGSRKKILIGTVAMTILGVFLLSFVRGSAVWLAVIIAGMVRDGFMAIFLTMVIENKGVGPAYAGTATGFVLVFSSIGNLVAPPLGNSLAAGSPGAPFLFWAGMAGFGLICLFRCNFLPRQHVDGHELLHRVNEDLL